MLSMYTDIDCLLTLRRQPILIGQQNATVQVLPDIIQKICENIHWSQSRASIPAGIKSTIEIRRCENHH